MISPLFYKLYGKQDQYTVRKYWKMDSETFNICHSIMNHLVNFRMITNQCYDNKANLSSCLAD